VLNDHAHLTTSVGLLTPTPGTALYPLPPTSRIYLSCKAFCAPNVKPLQHDVKLTKALSILQISRILKHRHKGKINSD
jgi:hypothetical protein